MSDRIADSFAGGRLREVLATAAELRHDTRALLDQLRRQIGELRVQRQRLHEGYRRQEPRSAAGLRARFGLTDRELEVAGHLADGRGNSAIAAALRISPHTARHHTQRVLEKLGVHSRAEAGALLRG
jgi:DNA-binding CsgD family transcriptional regulator